MWLDRCATGYYRMNGRCQICPDAPWVIFVFVILLAMCIGYLGYMLEKKEVSSMS